MLLYFLFVVLILPTTLISMEKPDIEELSKEKLINNQNKPDNSQDIIIKDTISDKQNNKDTQSNKDNKSNQEKSNDNQNDIDFFAHINKYILPLKGDFKNYIIPGLAKIGTTSSTIVTILNLVSNPNNGITIPSWLPVVTTSFTFIANFLWLVQHASDKNQIQLFLNKINNTVQQAN